MEKKILPNIKMHRRHINIFWWSKRWIHIKFITRELTSICVAIYVMLLLLFIVSVFDGPASFESYLTFMKAPGMIVLHVFFLFGLIYHSITWFNLAPKAMVLKVGDKNIPGYAIALANYIGWLVLSLALLWLLGGNKLPEI